MYPFEISQFDSERKGSMDWFWAAISGIVFLFLLKQLLLTTIKKKKLPPGPLSIPILGHFHLFGKNPHQDLYRLARKHGPIMFIRLGLVPVVVVSSAAGAELILKTHDLIFANRPYHEASKYVSYGQRNVVFGRYGPSWRNLRKLCTTELLTQFRINQFMSIRKTEVGVLVDSLKQASENHEVTNLSVRVFGLTADMICLMVFWRKFEDKDLDGEGFKGVIKETLQVLILHLGDYFPLLEVLDLQGLTRRMKLVRKIFDDFLEKIISDHVKCNKGEKNEVRDFLDVMMGKLESGEAGFEFDRRHVKAVLLDMLIAGMDTTSAAVEWTLSELMRHPNVMKKLQKELEAVVGLEHMVEESHLDHLQYLDCVIKETLRLHPVVPLLIHESMKDCEIDRFHIPNKCRTIVNVWAIGRDPDVWHDFDSFSPERFINSDIDLRGHNFELIPFGSGRRGCPGLLLGLVVVRLVVAQLVHCFDWESSNSLSPKDLDMLEHVGLVTTRANHLMATPKYRLLK